MIGHEKKIVFVSAVHDFRTPRRGSIQSLASAAARNGNSVTFVSLRFSVFSLLKGDPRTFLLRRANRPETVDSIVCYLWFTLIHPFQSRHWLLKALCWPYYFIHKHLKNAFVEDCFREADYIVIESGQGVLFAERARRLNPHARIIYRASDRLSTIGAADILQSELERHAHIFDWFCLLSAKMSDEFAWVRDRCYLLPQGIDPDELKEVGVNPYDGPVNAVSVGSMLFDPDFFRIAGDLFPNIQFHAIGCGTRFDVAANVKLYGEMPFRETLRYIKYATFGVAPYRNTQGAEYLATSSLKLKQYECFRIPAVCPSFAAGQSKNRFGYEPGDAASIKQAIEAALGNEFVPVPLPLNWLQLAERMLAPYDFADCDLTGPFDEPRSANVGAVERVTLISCTLGNRKRQLERLLKSLGKQEFAFFEIIIVDQNPPGYIDDVLQALGPGLLLKHVRSAPGLSVARNVGLAHASGQVIGFPDDDCWYLPATLRQVVEFFNVNPGVDVLLGRTVDTCDRPSLSPLRRESGTVTKSNVWTSGNSNTMFIRRKAVPAGGFDERIGIGATSRFQSGEETDFILKSIDGGAQAIYIASLKICHDQVENGAVLPAVKRAWRYSQGFGFVLMKHRFGLPYVLYRVMRSIGSAAWSAARLDIRSGSARMAWGMGTLLGYVISHMEIR